MVLSSHSRCMILTMVRNFNHLLPTLRLICGVLGRRSVAYLGYLCCQAEEWFARGCTRSNPDLMEDKMFRGERGNGLTLRKHLVFLFELLISTLLSGGMGLVSFFLKEDDPYSMRIELLEGSIAWIDHLR